MHKYFKDDQQLRQARLAPCRPSSLQPALAEAKALLIAWHQIGGILEALYKRTGVSPEKTLAVWAVESGDLHFVPGKPVLRLECHKLWEEWGYSHPAVFDEHFQFGGHGGITGLPWTNHRFRQPGGEWRNFHGTQQTEREAFALAADLAGKEAASRATSFGGPQVMGFNHRKLGYEDARSLHRAFAGSLRAQVLGFFDFCRSEDLIAALESSDWHGFARVYNGPARVDFYAEKINDAARLARCIVSGDRASLAGEERLLAFDHEGFAQFLAGLDLRNFSAREFLFRGRENSMPASDAYGLNRHPPRDLWPNIVPAARAADAFRSQLGAPVTLLGIYRTPEYNAAIGGSPQSQHIRFAAIDLRAANAGSPRDWMALMRRIREQGIFKGAIGLHEDSLHIDARGTSIDL